MENHILSIEQMRHLNKLGVDTSDASWAWVHNGDCVELMPHKDAKGYATPNNITPAYDAVDILNKLVNPWLHFNSLMNQYCANCAGSQFNSCADTPLQALYEVLCFEAFHRHEMNQANAE